MKAQQIWPTKPNHSDKVLANFVASLDDQMPTKFQTTSGEH